MSVHDDTPRYELPGNRVCPVAVLDFAYGDRRRRRWRRCQGLVNAGFLCDQHWMMLIMGKVHVSAVDETLISVDRFRLECQG
jgi:hypothetical protein